MDGCRVSAAPRVRGQDAARSTRRKRSTASEVLQPAKQASKSSSQKSEAIRNDEPTLGEWTSQVVLEYMIPSSHPLVEMHRIRKSAGTAPPPPRAPTPETRPAAASAVPQSRPRTGLPETSNRLAYPRVLSPHLREQPLISSLTSRRGRPTLAPWLTRHMARQRGCSMDATRAARGGAGRSL